MTVHRAVAEKHVQLKQQIAYFQKSGQLKFFHGHAKFASKNEVNIVDAEGKTQTIWADNTVMTAGSRPRYLPNIPIDEKIIMTSDGASSLPDFPKSIVILGAGVIGCEFATIFSNFGKTKVYLIDKEERILPFEDEDISRAVAIFPHPSIPEGIQECARMLMCAAIAWMQKAASQTCDRAQSSLTLERSNNGLGISSFIPSKVCTKSSATNKSR